jgi:hypothetical protein
MNHRGKTPYFKNDTCSYALMILLFFAGFTFRCSPHGSPIETLRFKRLNVLYKEYHREHKLFRILFAMVYTQLLPGASFFLIMSGNI